VASWAGSIGETRAGVHTKGDHLIVTEAKRYFVRANPGYWVLELVRDPANDGFAIERTPVVAWEMIPHVDKDSDHPCFVYPVTTDDDYDERVRLPVLGPDGCVRITGTETFDTEQDWLKHAIEKLKPTRGAEQ
jgi:hypothetical protein